MTMLDIWVSFPADCVLLPGDYSTTCSTHYLKDFLVTFEKKNKRKYTKRTAHFNFTYLALKVTNIFQKHIYR